MSIFRFFPSNWALHIPASTVSREICWCFEAETSQYACNTQYIDKSST
jgi:hypothetical protein